ncbi:MAG: flap endonuclease [Gammaproteobacteria bacterium]|nr:flap endonuclease [Gammaproteobacteria bacterium]
MNDKQKPRAYLIDSSIYIFRAWHVFDDDISDTDGNPANAVYGFSEFLFELIKKIGASCGNSYIACAFDASQTDSYRREIYAEYKANRPPAPEELKRQFAYCRDFCRAVGIADYSSNRFEADDIIGTLAHRLRQQGFAITIISADKDLAQLVINKEDFWWDYARDNMLDAKGVEKQFGVRPEQIADMLALSGDKVDNIPGIPGIGYTLASRILGKFQGIEQILENIEQISKMKFRGSARVQNLVAEHQSILPMTKKLTTIVTDAQFQGPKQDILWRGVEEALIHPLFDQLDAGEMRRKKWLTIS